MWREGACVGGKGRGRGWGIAMGARLASRSAAAGSAARRRWVWVRGPATSGRGARSAARAGCSTRCWWVQRSRVCDCAASHLAAGGIHDGRHGCRRPASEIKGDIAGQLPATVGFPFHSSFRARMSAICGTPRAETTRIQRILMSSTIWEASQAPAAPPEAPEQLTEITRMRACVHEARTIRGSRGATYGARLAGSSYRAKEIGGSFMFSARARRTPPRLLRQRTGNRKKRIGSLICAMAHPAARAVRGVTRALQA